MIIFTNGWLHVGLRKDDWTDVFAQPILEDMDDDGAPSFKLQKKPKGEPGPREPMEGEVSWNAFFDPKNCLSSVKAERERLQRQFIYDAWRYLNEKNPAAFKRIEKELDKNTSHRKWCAWYLHAKKWKRSRMRARGARRTAQESTARELGQDPTELEINSDSEDSAYGTEAEERFARDDCDEPDPPRGARRSNMGPPPAPPPRRAPGPSAPKRRGSGNGRNDSSKKAKTSKKATPKGRGKGPAERAEPSNGSDGPDEDYFMSGGRGDHVNHYDGTEYLGDTRRQNSQEVIDGRADVDLTHEDDGDDESEQDFDTSPPENYLPTSRSAASSANERSGTAADYPTPRSKSSKSSSPLRALGTGLTGGTGTSGRRVGGNRPGTSATSPARGTAGSLFVTGSTASNSLAPSSHREGSVFTEQDHNNGGVTEAEAIRQAMRASLAPESGADVEADEAEDIAQAVRASLAPENRPSDD